MARTQSPLRVQHFVQGQHDITSKAQPSVQYIPSPIKPALGFDDESLSSTPSTMSRHYTRDTHATKRHLSYSLERYQSLARAGLTPSTAKEAVLWCSLGLGAAVASLSMSPTQLQSPLSAESRSGSNGSLATISDSGFAPSVEIGQRHSLSLRDPDVEHLMTNLIGGLTGLFTSNLLDPHEAPHSLVLPDVGEGFDDILSHLELSKGQEIPDVTIVAAKMAAQLLYLFDGQHTNAEYGSIGYWELCLKVVESYRGDRYPNKSYLRSQLAQQAPPPSLGEPALSYLVESVTFDGSNDKAPFPTLDLTPKAHQFIPRFRRQTRSRAASLMSHSSLRSFSSIRSIASLSAKSPASLSVSRDIGIAYSSSPTGSFDIQSPVSAYSALESLAQAHQLESPRRHALIPGNDYPATAPNSPLRPRAPTISRSMSGNLKGKGKEDCAQLPEEGLRPGSSNVSVRTGTRFAMTCPPSPTGAARPGPLPKMDPVLAALERGSRFKSKSVCLNCGVKGTNYPCCPRCGEAWCSRDCRIEANNGGRHVCKRSATMPSA